jgi:hypothetical protein
MIYLVVNTAAQSLSFNTLFTFSTFIAVSTKQYSNQLFFSLRRKSSTIFACLIMFSSRDSFSLLLTFWRCTNINAFNFMHMSSVWSKSSKLRNVKQNKKKSKINANREIKIVVSIFNLLGNNLNFPVQTKGKVNVKKRFE